MDCERIAHGSFLVYRRSAEQLECRHDGQRTTINGFFACTPPPVAHLKTLRRADDEAARTGGIQGQGGNDRFFFGRDSSYRVGFVI
jgi:hypothetical protein